MTPAKGNEQQGIKQSIAVLFNHILIFDIL